ncbi:MAG: CRISPR-associated endonuclease Cas2 [Ruminococcaceae bacterium]|nr:CRISPR-associated endonuclease Cas2 [Oscillospiraceae bacterium]
MLTLITYDVCTADAAGRKRLSKVAKICVNYGQRVQNSVFECELDNAQLIFVRDKLRKAMDEKQDSLRIYNLGNHYASRIEHYGVKNTYDPEDAMIL